MKWVNTLESKMKYQVYFLLFAGLFLNLPALSQTLPYNPIFDDTSVPKITILIPESSLAQILSPSNAFSDVEYEATFVFESPAIQDTVENIGFRLRGNTSRVSRKQSFKVSFNTFEQGGKFYGLEKLNLNGEHNDPSIIRSKLSWDLFQSMGLPGTRANHIALYINDEYRGLYINVEHIDEQFLDTRFGNDDGNLYKCLFPADLTYRGPNGSDYQFISGDRRTYDLKLKDSDDGAYDDLADLISILNNTSDDDFPGAIQQVFDVNGYLKILALEVLSGGWDGYWFLKNNYYLYFNPATGLAHFIPYDYDNTFGIDFVNQDWGTRDIYNWGHPSEARPLTTRILNVPAFRDRYTFYLNQTIDALYNTAVLFPRIDSLKEMIQPYAESDPFRTLDYGFDVAAFNTSFERPLGGHVEYGLKPFISTRKYETVAQLDAGTNVSPIIDELSIQTSPARPAPADPVTISVSIEDESDDLSVVAEYRLDQGEWQVTSLSDNGMDGDQFASDGTYTATLPAQMESGTLSVILSATDTARQTSFANTQSIQIGFPQVDLYINEFMASNATTTSDDLGEFDDWVELYNGGSASINLQNKFLTDNLTRPDKWALPAITLDPGTFLLLWLDGQEEQGARHAPFKLSAAGESIGLFGQDDLGFYPIDTLTYAIQTTDVSFARTMDGTGDFEASNAPTPGMSNQQSVSNETLPGSTTLKLYTPFPNPFNTKTTVSFVVAEGDETKIEVYDVLGRRIAELWSGPAPAGEQQIVWRGTTAEGIPVNAGVYFIRLQSTQSGMQDIQPVILHR